MKTEQKTMDIFSKPFATDALDREIKKQWAENNMRHQEKVRLLEECTEWFRQDWKQNICPERSSYKI